MKRAIISLLFASALFAQDSPEQIIEKVIPSVATVLSGNGNGALTSTGSAVATQSDGVLLTTHHLVKNAGEVQIRFKNGESFDDVQLLGVDQRRDIAAIRITATNLPVLQTRPLQEVKPGLPVYVISTAGGLPWTASSGIISAIRMADEVPGAGSGYRLVQFTAAVSPGSSGGVLVDADARLIGVILGSSASVQNLNFAVPVENVLGLAKTPPVLVFRSGSKLRTPTAIPTATTKSTNGLDIEGPEKSETLSSKDPKRILERVRTIYAHSKTVWMNRDILANALRKHPDFDKLGLILVESQKLADVIVTADRALFSWDWSYTAGHQNTSIVLTTGKFTRIDGMTGAGAIAKDLLLKIKESRKIASEAKTSTDSKTEPKTKP